MSGAREAAREVLAAALAHDPLYAPDLLLHLRQEGLRARDSLGACLGVRQPALERAASLRVAEDPDGAARLLREAALASRLDHPGIPAVLDAGRGDDGRLRVLEAGSEGRSLTPAGEGVESLRERVQAVLRAAEVLAFAHRQGVAHGRLHPGCIRVGEFGQVLVTEWWQARLAREARPDLVAGLGPPPPGPPAPLPPPELGEGEPTPASDVWALGAILARLLPRRLDRELSAVLARATALEPEERYPDAEGLVGDLRAWLRGDPVAARPRGPLRRLLLQGVQHAPVLGVLLLTTVLALAVAGAAVHARGAAVERGTRQEQARARADTERALGALRPESSAGQAVDPEAAIAEAIMALAASQRWAALAGDDPAAHEARLTAALELVRLASGAGEWALAEEGLAEVARLGAADPRLPLAEEALRAARAKRREHRLEEARAVCARLASGAARREPDGLDEALIALLRPGGEEARQAVLEALGGCLDTLEEVRRRELLTASGAPPAELLGPALEREAARGAGQAPDPADAELVTAAEEAVGRVELERRLVGERRGVSSRSGTALTQEALARGQQRALGPRLDLVGVACLALPLLDPDAAAVAALGRLLRVAAEPALRARGAAALLRCGAAASDWQEEARAALEPIERRD